jgi:hypothetical protein
MNIGRNTSGNRGMNCAEIHERVVLAAYSELPDDEAHALAQHLAGCAECREEQEQLLALKKLSAAHPVLEPNANLIARSRTRLEETLDAIPPKRWYDRVGDWMTRTATGLQSAPVAACLLLVAGAGLGSLGGYEFSARHEAAKAQEGTPKAVGLSDGVAETKAGDPAALVNGEIASVSGVAQEPNSNLVVVNYKQMEPRRMRGTIADPAIRQLLMLGSQYGASPDVRNDSVGLLAAACRSGNGCGQGGVQGGQPGVQGASIRDALMVSLRYDRNAHVRQKALEGLQPFVADDMEVRDAVLEALLNDSEPKIREAAIGMLEPVQADTSVRQVLSTVASSDQNPHIRNASRVVLRRVSDVQ